MKRHTSSVLCVIGILGLADRSWANAGTPMMWATLLHLSVGNTLIGLAEGALLAGLFSAPLGKSLIVMIVANYVSAWVGATLICGPVVNALPIDLANGWAWLWRLAAATYVLTLVLEWPFVAWCCRGTQFWFKRSLTASVVIQSMSYAVLCGWYGMASGTSLYTEMNVVPASSLSLPSAVLVYFIDPTDGNVYARHLAHDDAQRIYDLRSTGKDDRLFVRPSTKNAEAWDLIARVASTDYREPTLVVIRTNMEVGAALESANPSEGTWFNFGRVPRLYEAGNKQWTFHTGFWPIEGLSASNSVIGKEVAFSYETPFGAWAVRNAVQVAPEKVLFQLGENQICAFDPTTRQVALLWHGRGPVPVLVK